MADTVPAFAIVTRPSRTMFAKRTGKHTAALTGRYGTDIVTTEADSASAAKAELIEQLAILAEHDIRQTYVFCGDGETVLHVYRTFNGWAYNIVSAKRTMASGCHMNCETRKQAEEQAIAHADQSFGGTVQIIR